MNKKLIIAICIIVALIVCSIVSIVVYKNFNDNDSDNDSSSSETSETNSIKNVAQEIYTEASENVSNTSDKLNDMEKELHNSKFLPYEGSIRGPQVKVLLELVVSSNSDDSTQVTIEMNDTEYSTSEEISKLKTTINATKKYSISFDYDDDLINKIIIK